MSTRRSVIRNVAIAVLAVLLLLGATSAFTLAQGSGYDLGWWTADGGGGRSSGNGYTLHGTAGQPDAGTLSGNGYTLAGGFWAGAALQFDVYIPVVIK